MNQPDLAARATFAKRLAREAGALALRYFNRELAYTPQSKGAAQDWVSIADRAVEDHCRAQLATAFPGDTMLGEESGGALADRAWVIDPIDGTLNFVHGVRYWCVSIVFIAGGERRIGAVYDPPHDELFFATAGGGATLDERPMRVSACARLDRALIVQGYVQRHAVDTHLALRRALIREGAEVKDHGAGALMLAHVAAGRFDAYLEPHMHPWDASAGLLLVDEAGGRTLRYPGARGLREGGPVLASTPALYDRLEALAGW